MNSAWLRDQHRNRLILSMTKEKGTNLSHQNFGRDSSMARGEGGLVLKDIDGIWKVSNARW